MSRLFMRLKGRVFLGMTMVVLALALVGVGVFLIDIRRMERSNADMLPPTDAERAVAAPAAAAHWRTVERDLEARLRQGRPLELGAVWSTRDGVICGTVNERHSFGFVSGMLPFYAQGRGAVFGDGDQPFRARWFDCRRDRWVVLHAGSDETGVCAVRSTGICRRG